MSIIWCGGESIDFIGGTATTFGSYYRSTMARCSIQGDGYTTNPFGPITEFWFSCRFLVEDKAANKDGVVFKEGSLSVIDIGAGSNDSTVVIRINNVVVATSAAILGEGTLYKLDVYVDYAVAGSVVVYLNTGEVLSYSGDITTSGATGIDGVQINNFGGGVGDYTYYSELIVADEDTRLMELKTLYPNAAGDASDWTNSYTSIDEIATSDADTIYTETADQEFQCNLTGMPTGDYICKAVMINARATDGVGGLGIQLGIKTNSTVDLGDAITLGGIWEHYSELYQQNPVTTNRFTPAEIDALQFAVKAVTV